MSTEFSKDAPYPMSPSVEQRDGWAGAAKVRLRLALLRAMRAEINLWENEYAQCSYAIAKGVLDGAITAQTILGYPLGQYPEHLCKTIARQVGLPYVGDDIVRSPGGWVLNVSAEGIQSGVAMLRAVSRGDAGIHDGDWAFYPETLRQHGLTIEQVREQMRAHSTPIKAARLVVDAHRIPLEDTH